MLGLPLAKLPIQLTKYEQKLFGKLPNGNVFLTNPTRCETWYSGGYAEFYGNNPTAETLTGIRRSVNAPGFIVVTTVSVTVGIVVVVVWVIALVEVRPRRRRGANAQHGTPARGGKSGPLGLQSGAVRKLPRRRNLGARIIRCWVLRYSWSW